MANDTLCVFTLLSFAIQPRRTLGEGWHVPVLSADLHQVQMLVTMEDCDLAIRETTEHTFVDLIEALGSQGDRFLCFLSLGPSPVVSRN